MELSTLFSRASPLAPIPIPTTKTLRTHASPSILFVKIPSRTSSAAVPNSVTLRVSAAAAAGQPRRRRNALRDKLAREAQVRNLLEFQSRCPIPENFAAAGDAEPSPDAAVLWDRLERWVDEHKSDSELWGVEGEEAAVVVDGLPAVPLSKGPVLGLLPKVGLAVLCGGCVFWVGAKLFGKNEKAVLTREEKEMLRRKKKSRMEREELEKGGVEILVDSPLMECGRRPQMDREELMKSIVEAKTARESSIALDSSGGYVRKDPDFDAKVREIREMARRARESEQEERSRMDKQGEEDDFASMLLAGKDRKLHSEAGLMKRWLEDGNFPDINSLSQDEKDMNYSMDSENTGMPVEENSVDVISSTPSEDSLELLGSDHEEITANNSHKTKEREYMKPSAEIINETTDYTSKADTSSAGVLKHEENYGENKAKSIILQETEPSESSCNNRKGVSQGMKPKIITSVKEAKQYLAKKRGPKNVRPDKKDTAKPVSPHLNTHNSVRDGKPDNKMNRTGVEDTKDVEPSKIWKPKSVRAASVASSPYGDKHSHSLRKISLSNNGETKTHEDRIVSGKFSMKNNVSEVLGEKSATSRYDIPNRESVKSLGINGRVPPSLLGDMKEGKTESSGKILLAVDRENIDCLSNSHASRMEILEDEQKISGIQSGRDNCTFDVYNNRLSLESLEACSDESSLFGSSDGETLGLIASSKESNSEKIYGDYTPSSPPQASPPRNLDSSTSDTASDNCEKVNDMDTPFKLGECSSKKSGGIESDTKAKPVTAEKSWIEENFQEFDPIIKKIGVGFKDNYMVAKEKAHELSSLSSEISDLGQIKEDEELEWMNDERLREIVFKVRDNELGGRDPFHSMEAADKHAFFQGLERKVEKVNEKLLGVHEYIHSRVENLDYGADGISLYDPLDKIIPRWKGPALDKDPAFVKRFISKQDSQNSLQTGDNLSNSNAISPTSSIDPKSVFPEGASRNPKTLIECSDGSSRAGKKTGKEHWEHTKKWSQGFLDVYNSETDPEIKSIMKDMGKGLDRWITQKEIQDATDLMTRIPKRKRRYIEKKMDKIKREMELYGQQAVLSKYREYSDEQEEDYLWWLDLSCVLCIELYTIEDGTQKVGFYSLEMAADLELDPKQYHVIAFEDTGDAKNFCYIVQAHLEMLGIGNAFVVPRPPKDAFREAKADGFNVTVIKRGELKLNIDQTLEEADEDIVEIGSKMYHDKIMRERAVDMRILMKGMIRADISTKRKSRRMLTKSAKS